MTKDEQRALLDCVRRAAHLYRSAQAWHLLAVMQEVIDGTATHREMLDCLTGDTLPRYVQNAAYILAGDTEDVDGVLASIAYRVADWSSDNTCRAVGHVGNSWNQAYHDERQAQSRLFGRVGRCCAAGAWAYHRHGVT